VPKQRPFPNDAFLEGNLGDLVALLYKSLPLYLDDPEAFDLAISVLLSHPNMDWMSLSQKIWLSISSNQSHGIHIS
jgi:hypothetical protein